MTPSGSVAGHLTDLVSGEVSWARARPRPHHTGQTVGPVRHRSQLSGSSRGAGSGRATGSPAQARRAPLCAGPARQRLQPEVAVLEPVNLLCPPPFTVTASPAHPSSFPPPRAGQGFPSSAASRRNGQCQAEPGWARQPRIGCLFSQSEILLWKISN